MDEHIISQIACAEDRAYKVNAPTIEERSDIWRSCASLKARNRLIVFLIFASIGLIFYTLEKRNFIYTTIGVIGAILIGILVYMVNINTFEKEADDLLTYYNEELQKNPSITIDEFTDKMNIRDLEQLKRQRQQQYRQNYGRRRHISTPGFSFSFG